MRIKKDTELFKQVFNSYYQTLVNFALKFVNNDIEIARDIVQDTFIELWENDVIQSDIIHIKAFLYTTTRNKSLNILKHKKVQENYLSNSLNNIKSERYYIDHIIQMETMHLIKRAIDILPEQSKEVILLNLKGLKNKEISEQIGITVDTVKYHKTRAYRILRKYLKNKIWILLPIAAYIFYMLA
ncbi:MAG: RNA polymerase sigma-70 factor [Chlorobi bacterium]|nr:RNA polymerase sigma-70 factor [Chlorobiota bacterium]